MQKLTLTVPINVHAVFQEKDMAVVGPEMDFESLPYFDKDLKLDMNPDIPYLAESVIPRPFEDTNFLLKRGVHLNWDFPKFLKTTAFGAERSDKFPAVPTRWLISRFAENSDILDADWIVESDAILTNLKGAKIYDMAQTSLPVDIHSGKRPYTYMGRVEKLEDWKKNEQSIGENYTNWENEHQENLTAMAWGSPSFDVFYPNCQGVFGFHDPDGTEDHSYKVVGWYHNLENDYWINYLNKKKGKFGFSEIDNLTHLTEKRREKLKKELFLKAVQKDLNIEVSLSKSATVSASPDSWERMICCGASQFLNNEELDKSSSLFAMGNTPIEALSAMIVEKGDMGTPKGSERVKLEDSLSSMLMGDRLKSRKLDIGPKFREFRHSDEFIATDGGLRWVIEKINDNPNQEENTNDKNDRILPPPLPKEILPLLENLNIVQREYDRIKNELESSRFELYSDWYRYMHASYPPSGETEEYVEVSDLRAMIQNGSLKKVRGLRQLLGNKSGNYQSGLAHEVEIAKEKLQKEIDTINNDIQSKKHIYLDEFHWEIQHRPASRFWEPTPPALVIAIAKNQPKETDEQTESDTLNKPLVCQIKEFKNINFAPSSSFSADSILRKTEITWTLSDNPYATDLPIFRGEWEVEVYPVATMHSVTKSSGNYDPEFVNNNYLLGENEPDLDDNASVESPLALTPTGSLYTGSTYINQKLDDRYRSLLKTYQELQYQRIEALEKQLSKLKEEKKTAQENLSKAKAANRNQRLIDQLNKVVKRKVKALENLTNEKTRQKTQLDYAKKAMDFLNNHDLLVITLNGFNSALLQRHESIQLNPADPLGFEDYQGFAKEVAEGLRNNFKGSSPDPHAVFMPIRSGALQVIDVRLVDIFGRFTELVPQDVSTSISMYVSGHNDWVRLPPRISQAARWNFRFLNCEPNAASGQHSECLSHPDSSPIHGWIVPNLLNKTLDFFQPNGSRIGSIIKIDKDVKWESNETVEYSDYLHKIKNWIIDKNKGESFLDAFTEDIEEAMDNIHPNDREGQSAFSVLMGRPIAIVHLGVDLELKGLPEINVSWGELYNDLNRTERSTDDFEKVKFPYRIGEYRQRNDGLVGYWLLNDEKELSTAFNVNDAVSGSINTEKVQGGTTDNWLNQKNEDWKIQDSRGRTLFEYLLDEKDETIKKQDLIQPYIREGSRVWESLKEKGFIIEETPYDPIRHYAEAQKLNISPADDIQHFIALADPYGLIHLSSGIQPVKAIQLPNQFIKDALNRIEMTFLTAPILTPEDHLQISIPKEQEYTWLWRESNRWPTQADEAYAETDTPEKDIEPFRTTANFPDRVVIREGRLVLKHRPEEGESE